MPRYYSTRQEKIYFQERVLPLSPQIPPPFSSSASQTAVCMCLKGRLWGFWDSINAATEVYTGAYKGRTRGSQFGRMPGEEELNLGGLLRACISPTHSPYDHGSFIVSFLGTVRCGKMEMKKPNICAALKLSGDKGMERPKGLSPVAEPQVTTPVGLLCSMYTYITDIMIIIKAHIN